MSAITLLHGAHGRAVFLAVPVYDSLSAGTAFSLFEAAREIDAELAVLAHCCHVDDARNMLVRRFLDSDADDLVFIDADLQWESGALEKLLSYDADIVAGSYPKKQDRLDFPIRFLGGELQADDQGLIEVAGAPTGFMRIRRKVLESLASQSKQFQARQEDQQLTPLIFERGFSGKSRIGGDYNFCEKARKAGFRVHIDPELWFEHAHVNGSIGALLREQNGLGLGYALSRLRDGGQVELFRYCRELYRAWGNKWTLIPSGLVAAVSLAKQSRSILECGTGVSTLAMAAANPDAHIHALENEPEWVDRIESEANRYGLTNVTVHVCPIVDGWYQVPDLPDFDMVLVDGPAFTQKGVQDHSLRHGVFDLPNIENAVVIMDDAHWMGDILTRYQSSVVGKIAICVPQKKAIAA